jgi:hypothetical protein
MQSWVVNPAKDKTSDPPAGPLRRYSPPHERRAPHQGKTLSWRVATVRDQHATDHPSAAGKHRQPGPGWGVSMLDQENTP